MRPTDSALATLERRFASVEKAARIGYWRMATGSLKQTWSPGMFDLMGVEVNSFRATPDWLLDRIHPDDKDIVMSGIHKGIAEKGPFFYRCRVLTTTGAIRHFDTFGEVELNDAGDVVAILGVVQEVSDKHAAEEAVKASEEAYRFLADEASDIISRHSASGSVQFVSPAVKRVLGYDPDNYMGQLPWEHYHPEDVETVTAAINVAKRTGEPQTYAYRARHRLGHYVWMESTTRVILEGDARTIKGSISVSRDITQRKAAEAELLRQREHAEAASQTKTRFLANMSHELRTPLNAIIGFSDILNKELFGPLGSERYLDYAKLIHESGELLLDLINDLLDMSKIEAGKFELHYEEMAAQELANSCVRIVSHRAEEKGLQITIALQPTTFLFRADQRAMKQIILNLLSNAVKFSNKGEITLDITRDDDRVQIAVRDNGIGIPADVLPRLCQPFEQASNEASRQQGGSGLGLALVKSLATLHGGMVAIDSAEGLGTCVTVTLPVTDQAAKAA